MHRDVKMAVVMKLIYILLFRVLEESVTRQEEQRCDRMDQSLYKAIHLRTSAFATPIWCICVRVCMCLCMCVCERERSI